MRSSIQAAMARSHGPRSASVSGIPARILATFAAGWKSSASANRQPRRSASRTPTVVLPLPETPAMITITRFCRFSARPRRSGDLVSDHNLAGVHPLDRDHPGTLGVREADYGLALGRVHGDIVRDVPLSVVDPHPEHGGQHALQAVVAAERDVGPAAVRHRDDRDGVGAVVELA